LNIKKPATSAMIIIARIIKIVTCERFDFGQIFLLISDIKTGVPLLLFIGE